MSTFTERLYQSAAKSVASRGADVSFSSTGSESFDETSSEPSETTVVVAGKAVEIPGDPEVYIELELIDFEPVTLIFVPATMGQVPAKGSVVYWAGSLRTVRDRLPYRPQGVALAARLILT